MVKDPVPLQEVHRVLVIKLRHHGDVLLSSPVFSVLKAHATHIEIDALVYADTAEMLTLHPDIHHVHKIDRKWKKLNPLKQINAEWRLLSTLRNRRYQLIVHLTEHPRGAWLARLLGACWSVAPRLGSRSAWWSNSFTHLYSMPSRGKRHAVELNLDALRRIGLYPSPCERKLTLVPGTEAQQRVATLLKDRELPPQSFIHLHPGSRWTFKCWPTEKTAELIDRLSATGHRIVITAAPDTNEMAMIERILSRCSSQPINLGGQLSLKDMAVLTSQARLFIGVDSAPMHIAAAVGTPLVALFGPSGDDEWGPWQVKASVIASDDHPCRPCGQDGCGGGKISDCLEQIEVSRVFKAAQDLLAYRKVPS